MTRGIYSHRGGRCGVGWAVEGESEVVVREWCA